MLNGNDAVVGTTGSFTVPDDVTEEKLCLLYTRHILASCNGNKTAASRRLGIDRRSLYRRLEKAVP